MADEHRFERHLEAAWAEHRGYLLNIAYRLLGSLEEAEDMVQEAYLRLLRSDLGAITDLRGWLVVVTTRICLDHLGSARVQRETRIDSWLPEPIVGASADLTDPADALVLDESVRMALLIVLERLKPAERVVFVLHDVFQYSFQDIGPMVGRSPAACRQLASRARRRMGAEPEAIAPVDAEAMRRVAERFIAACQGADLQPLLDVLDPAVVGWTDVGGRRLDSARPALGRAEVANGVRRLFGPPSRIRLTLTEVNGETGIIATIKRRPIAVIVLSVRDGLITAIYAIADEHKLARLGS
jgi:RNA polymerase sigma-70 factor, ECF subfamily